MPQTLHCEWVGFDRLQTVDETGEPVPGIPAKARCQKCKRTFTKITQRFLKTHKEICGNEKPKKPKNNQKRRNSTKNSARNASVATSSNSHIEAEEFDDNRSNNSYEAQNTNSTSPDVSTYESFSSSSQQNVGARSRHTSFSSATSEVDFTSHEDSSSDLLSRSSTPVQEEIRETGIRLNKRNKRKRADNNNNHKVSEKTVEQKEVGIYRYLLRLKIVDETEQLPELQKLLNDFTHDFEVPTAKELNTVVASRAADEIYEKNHSKLYNRIMELLVQVDEGCTGEQLRVYAVTLLNATKGGNTFVKRLQFSIEYGEDFRNELETFCNDSVVEAKREYGVDILFLLHDGQYNLTFQSELNYDDDTIITYYKVSEVIPMLSKVECSLMSNSANHQVVSEFYNQLGNVIPRAIDKEKLSMSDAVGRIFEAISTLDVNNKSIVCASLISIISPIHLATKVFHPQYHTETLKENVFKPVYKLLTDFHAYDGPASFVDVIPYYLDKTGGCFRMLYKKNVDKDPRVFWESTKLDLDLDNIKDLANYALQVLKIPAKLTNINLKDIFIKRDKYTIVQNDFDQVFFTYALQ